MIGRQNAHRTERRRFGHAPGVDRPRLMRGEALDQGLRAGCAADDDPTHRCHRLSGLVGVIEQVEPDGRYTGAKGNFFAVDDLQQTRPVKTWSGEDQPGADHGRRIGNPPGIDVEHRHDRQDAFFGRDAEQARLIDTQGMQDRRAVRIEDALGVPRRARRVTKPRRGFLVELRPVEPVGFRRQQVFVTQDRRQGRRQVLGHVRPVAHEDDAAQTLGVRCDTGHQGRKESVGEQVLTLRVVEDEDELFGEQARIDGVANQSGAGNAVIKLEMTMVVPRQGGNAIAGFEPQPGQRVGQLPHPPGRIGIAVAVQGRILVAGDDLLGWVIARGVFQHVWDEQRPIHHQTQHGASLCRRLCMGPSARALLSGPGRYRPSLLS